MVMAIESRAVAVSAGVRLRRRTAWRRSRKNNMRVLLFGQRSCGGKCRLVVRMVRYFFYILDVFDGVVLVQNENCATLDPQFLDQGAVFLPEGAAFVIGHHFDLIHAEGPAPTLLGERKIHTYGVNFDAWELGGFFIEALGLCVADGSIERWHDAKDSNHVSSFFQVHGLQGVADGVKIGRLVTGFQFRSEQCQRSS